MCKGKVIGCPVIDKITEGIMYEQAGGWVYLGVNMGVTGKVRVIANDQDLV